MSSRLGALSGPFCKSFLGSPPGALEKVCADLQAATVILRDGVTLTESAVIEKRDDPGFQNIRPGSITELAARIYISTHAGMVRRYEDALRDNDIIVPPKDRCEGCPLRGVLEGVIVTNQVEPAPAQHAIEATSSDNGISKA